MYRDKKVIVVMPAYNAARTVLTTYRDVMSQDYVDEVILVDDASKDDTVEIARGLERVTVHRHDAGEMTRPRRAFQVARLFTHRQIRAEAVGIHRVGPRHVHRVDALAAQHLEVVIEVARVALEVLARSELQRIDEDRRRDAIAFGARDAHQRCVALV